MRNGTHTLRWTVRCLLPAGLLGGSVWYGDTLAARLPRSWPLYLACTAGVVATGFGLYRSRRRGLKRIRELEQQRLLELERIRIAQDMHDSLGADLTRLALLADLARYESDREGVLRQLQKIATLSRDVVDSLNELVWATSPHHNTLADLAAYLREYASEVLAPTGLAVRFDFPDPLPSNPVSGELRRQLFLATKEALNNALKHARATEVRLSLTASEHELEIVVADNGCGLAPPPDGSANRSPNGQIGIGQGRGLRHLHERLAAAGGVAQLDSPPGQGTRVRLRAPLGGPAPSPGTVPAERKTPGFRWANADRVPP